MSAANVRPEEARRRGRLHWALADGDSSSQAQPGQGPARPRAAGIPTIQPIVFVLLFRYVFGGARGESGGTSHVDFLTAGIFVQALAFGAMSTGIGLAVDLRGVIVDGFRSPPMSRLAVLAGRTAADLARTRSSSG